MTAEYDALLFISFGGPEGMDDVIPFLKNVLRGRNVPHERMLEVAEHYYKFGGISPINQQTRELIAAVEPELRRHSIDLPIYWGNRNWDPLLTDTMTEMVQAGVKRAMAFVVSAYSSYSGCRQYRENIEAACNVAGENAPVVEKLRMFYNHPDFIAATIDHVRAAWEQIPEERRAVARIAYTAHSIPMSMANTCDYEQQLTETCRLVSEQIGLVSDRWRLVFQSRSGRPQDPWLEPDIVDHLRDQYHAGVRDIVVAPIGFLSDHLEVLYDLDDEAAQACAEVGLNMIRAGTVGVHPRFVEMIRKLVQERLSEDVVREAVGKYGPNWDICAMDCCPAPMRPASRPV